MSLSFILAAFLAAFPAPKEPDAVVKEDREVFRLTSDTAGEWTVSRTVVVHAKGGLGAAAFYFSGDSFHTLKSFSGTVTPANAKPLKIKMSDLESLSLGESLVDDGIDYAYVPSGHYPLTVHYEYKVSFHKGLSSFPTFIPVDSDNVAVEASSYTVDVPEGYPIKYAASKAEYRLTTEKGRDLHIWEVNDFQPLVAEHRMPPARELIPYVYVSPEVINLGGFPGMQRDWKELGAWLATLQDGSMELSEEEKARVRELTAGCTTPLEKLAVLYGHLREHTRYVSIQLGIGGLRPAPAREVSRMGFGDCKGLSNYLRALLAAVDVPSDYFIINTARPDVLPGYASVGQFDHAMLAVPLPELQDTVWVECTNPAVPLGYRHEDAAGHEVLLVKDGGGELVRIPAYPDSLSVLRRRIDVTLSADGSATLAARQERCLDYVDEVLSFRDLSPRKQSTWLTSYLKIQPEDVQVTGVTDNFADYPVRGHDFVPEMDIDYAFRSGVYANVSGSRIFVPLNPFAQALQFQKGERVNEFYRRYPVRQEDMFRVHLPEGYRLEGVPEAVSLDTAWGSLEASARLVTEGGVPGGQVLEVRQVLVLKAVRAPASDYPSYRDFARAVNRAFSATAVLVKD